MSRDGYLFYSSEYEVLANHLFGCWKCVAGVLFALHAGVLTAQARGCGPASRPGGCILRGCEYLDGEHWGCNLMVPCHH